MDSSDSAEAVRRVLQAINDRDLGTLSQWVTPGFVRHDTGGIFFDGRGPEGWAELIGVLLRALPDLHLDVWEVLATKDRAVAYLSASGTHQGELFGLRPTGAHVRYHSVDLYRLEEGRVAESWPMPDLAGIRRELAA